MNTKLKRTYFKSEEEWRALRTSQKQLGGSSIATVLGFGEYGESAMSLWLEKLGENQREFELNRFAEAGHMMEGMIKQIYHYYHPEITTAELFHNFRKKIHRINYTRNENCIIDNPDFPQFRFNIDSRIVKNWAGRKGVLEIKNTSHFAAAKYEDRFNPKFIIQAQSYMMGLNMDYGNVGVLIDANDFLCAEVERDEELISSMMKHSEDFIQKAAIANEIKASVGLKKYFGINKERLDEAELKAVEMIENIEPSMEGYDDIQLKRLRDLIIEREDGISMNGNKKQLKLVGNYLKVNLDEKQLKIRKQGAALELAKGFGEVSKLDFGDKHAATYNTDKLGRRRFNFSKALKAQFED